MNEMISIVKKFLFGGDVPREQLIAVDILKAAAKSGSAHAQSILAWVKNRILKGDV